MDDHPQRPARRAAASAVAIGCSMTAPCCAHISTTSSLNSIARVEHGIAPHHPRGADRLGQDHHRLPTIIKAGRRSSQARARARASARDHRPDQREATRPSASRTASSRPAFTPRPLERCRSQSIQTLHARAIRAETHAAAARRSAGRSTKPPRPARDLSQDHRRLSRRDPARPDRHAMPRRWARARRHLRDHHRVPAGRAS